MKKTKSQVYDSEWFKLRHRHLSAHPFCSYCGSIAEIVDHVVPIRIAPHRRLDPTNLQSLCKLCHDSAKQKEEKRGQTIGCDVDGIPLRGWD